MAARQIKWRRNQSQDTRKNESGPHGLSRGQPNHQQQRGHSKAPAADSGQPDDQGDHKSQEEIHPSVFSEKVWIPHSSFLPPQRPERASAPETGIAVHGSQPMLR